MRFIDSIISRYLTFKRNHFHLFKEGKLLKTFRNKHKGRRCFIIGNGPSLTANDLNKIKGNNDISFAFNRIYYIYKQTDWRPTYYISQDEKLLSGCFQEVNNDIDSIKFIPIELKWYNKICIKNAFYFHIINKNIDNNKPGFSEDISRYIVNSKTVVFSAIQIAVYMGIKEIYLIGVDHHFHTSINQKGEIIIDNTAKDYFSEEYNKDKQNLYIPNTDLSTFTYLSAKEYADEHGIKIYNATRGGRLEVFPRLDFESLFTK